MASTGLVVFLAFLAVSNGVVVNRCTLAKALLRRGVAKSLLGDWVCLAQFESDFRTSVTHKNTNGSIDNGIFQINNAYWCSNTAPQTKDCKIKCSALLDDNIEDDITCALIIYKRHKFSAWVAWTNKCKGTNTAKYLQGCTL